MYMHGYSLLELTLKETLRDILLVINPTDDDWAVRFHIIDELRSTIQSIESLRGATVEPFGSFVSNLFTRWGDLDISIELQNGSYIASPGRKHKQTLLADVLRVLRKKAGYRRLQFISNARVPILKLEANYNIYCDVSINNLSGQMKSKLLFWINEIDGRYRDLVLVVKEWAKGHRINDSKSGTLNSYCLCLLVVFHLQTLVPAILPPLREIYPGNMIDDLTGVRAAAEKHIEDTCNVNINRIKSDRSRLINRSSLSELFVSFLSKLSEICSRASTQGVSPCAGQWEDIESNMRWLPKTYALFVEDPFEQPANSARTVSSHQLLKISEAIEVTRRVLSSPNQNQASFVSVMVGPHISRLLVRTPIPNPAIPMITKPVPRRPPKRNQNAQKTNPKRNQRRTSKQSENKMDDSQNGATNGPVQAQASASQKTHPKRNQLPPQTQKQPQDKIVNSQNVATNGPVQAQASKSQKQQVWKPK